MTRFLVGLICGILATATVAWSVPSYKRSEWVHWRKVPGTCYDVRQQVLARDARPRSVVWSEDGCRVVTGLWIDPYTGALITDPVRLEVDHVVALAEAHASGGWAWSAERKADFANSTTFRFHLRTTSAAANNAKRAKPPDQWRPENPGDLCQYGLARAAVKFVWRLSSTPAERGAVQEMLASC